MVLEEPLRELSQLVLADIATLDQVFAGVPNPFDLLPLDAEDV